MTADAVDESLIGVVDHRLHGGAGGCCRVGITACVVTGGAVVAMGGKDVWPVLNRVTIRARLGIDHAAIGCRVDLHRMIDSTTCCAVVMAAKGATVAVLALAAGAAGRAGSRTIDG